MAAKLSITTDDIVASLLEFNDDNATLTTADLRMWCETRGYTYSTINNRLKKEGYQSGRGKFNLTAAQAVTHLEKSAAQPDAEPVGEVQTIVKDSVSLVPVKDDKYVPFGCFKDVKSVIKSKIFYPLFITGLSGNGKTHSVEQSCAQLGREVVRVNLTIETDQDDLIGGFRLVNGNTAWHDGPVIDAMRRGAVLLLDEVDLASNKIMCLQSVLEGKPLFLKKTGQVVNPAPGFNIIATANTKGKGSDSGMFIGTNVMNEAFLERFAVTFEQSYPTPVTEKKILLNNLKELGWVGDNIDKLCQNLVDWSDIIRKTYYDGGIDEVISTRRLLNVIKAYCIWDDINKAIELCTNRFDDDTASVFRELYQKVSGDAVEDAMYDTDEDKLLNAIDNATV